jgi:hypothetical protein
MRYPDFLIVGAARSGTTALHRMLKQHPQVFLPAVKEPCFFAFADEHKQYKGGRFAFAVRGWKAYLRLFSGVPSSRCAGESSTPYLYLHSQSITAMRRYLPFVEELKIIILLRHPVERTYSNYLWRVRDGREPLTFEQAISKEEERIRENYSFDYFYTRRSFYFEAVKAYKEAFRNVHIVLYDDLMSDTEGVMRGICEFLAIDPVFRFVNVPETNSSYIPRYRWLSRLVTMESALKFRIMRVLPEGWLDGMRKYFFNLNADRTSGKNMSMETRRKLLMLFREDTEKLSSLIGRDLSAWYE